MPSTNPDREKISLQQHDRYEEFAQHYTLCWNACEAYERCSWTQTTNRRSSQSASTSMLKNKHVQAAIAKIQVEQRKRYEATAERVIQEWAVIAFSNISNYVEWKDGKIKLKDSALLDETISRPIESLEIRTRVTESGAEVTTCKAKLWNKIAALEALSKHFGLYVPEKHDVNITVDEREQVHADLVEMLRQTGDRLRDRGYTANGSHAITE